MWKPCRGGVRLHGGPAAAGHAPHLGPGGASSLGRGPQGSGCCPRRQCVQAPLQRGCPGPGPLRRWGPRSRRGSPPRQRGLGRNRERSGPVRPRRCPCRVSRGARRPSTSAGQHYVLLVAAVVLSPGPRGAVAQRGLHPFAAHVVQPDGPGPGTVVGFAHAGPDASTAQLPAGHGAVPQVPLVIAHCPPEASMPHLQPAGTPVRPIGQTNPEGACSGRPRVRRGHLGSASSLHVPSTHLIPPGSPRWGRGLGLWMTLKGLPLGSWLMAPPGTERLPLQDLEWSSLSQS